MTVHERVSVVRLRRVADGDEIPEHARTGRWPADGIALIQWFAPDVTEEEARALAADLLWQPKTAALVYRVIKDGLRHLRSDPIEFITLEEPCPRPTT